MMVIRGPSLSLGRARRLLVPRARRRATRVVNREGPRARSPLEDTKLPTPPDRTRRRSTKGHPRLWVIRCSGPAGQLPLPEPAPSIPSTESTQEQDPSDDLFHEPKAQPKYVTAEILPRDHPTWPPAQDERLTAVIQARLDAPLWPSPSATRWAG